MQQMAPFYYTSKILLVTFLQFLLLKSVLADSNPKYIANYCEKNGNYTKDGVYQKNLYQVLRDLGTSGTDFSNSTNGESPDRVYGMFYCRADINPPLCQACVRAAAKQIVNNCINQKEGIIWYQECTLMYANRPLASLDEDNSPLYWFYSKVNVSNPIQFQQIMSSTMNDLIQKAAKNSTYHGYATAEVELPPYSTLYSLVQCTPDILGLTCERCLIVFLRHIQTYLQNSSKVTLLRPNCQMRYDPVPFYTPLPPPESPSQQPPSSQGKGILFYITRVVVPAVGFILLLLCVIAFYMYKRKKKQPRPAATQNDPPTDGNNHDSKIQHSNSAESLQYDLDTIKYATGNFSIDNKLGEGGFGPVYKGRLPNGQEMAVKRLSEDSRQGLREFTNEVQLVAKLQHRNLVKLLGFCLEGEEKLLVYEFVSNLSLDRFLFDPNRRKYLDWETRFKIIIGIARGLLYLHEDSRVKIIHRDLKISNILLDEEMNPKITDFGTARLVKIDHTQANTTKVFGTFGYMAPEYAAAGIFSIKSDVYSFGVMLLEIISAQSNNLFTRALGQDSLISHAWKLWNTGSIMELVDPSLGNNFSRTEVLRCIQVGLFCVQEDPMSRPAMESVLLILQNNSSDVLLPPRLSAVSSDTHVRSEHRTGEQGQFRSLQSDQAYSGNSTAQFTDLYPR